MSGTVPNVAGSEVPTSETNYQQGGSVASENSDPGTQQPPLFQAGLSQIGIDPNASGNLSGGGSTGGSHGVPHGVPVGVPGGVPGSVHGVAAAGIPGGTTTNGVIPPGFGNFFQYHYTILLLPDPRCLLSLILLKGILTHPLQKELSFL